MGTRGKTGSNLQVSGHNENILVSGARTPDIRAAVRWHTTGPWGAQRAAILLYYEAFSVGCDAFTYRGQFLV